MNLIEKTFKLTGMALDTLGDKIIEREKEIHELKIEQGMERHRQENDADAFDNWVSDSLLEED